MTGWTPADVLELVRLGIELIVFIVGLVGIFWTKADVKGMRKDVDGRFSELLGLVGRLAGAPERRSPGERRATDADAARPSSS